MFCPEITFQGRRSNSLYDWFHPSSNVAKRDDDGVIIRARLNNNLIIFYGMGT